jgi:acetyl esterase/lipase
MTNAVPPPSRTTAYGGDSAQVYDVREPTRAAIGVTVVVVHGGFWKAEWDRVHAAPQAQALADTGYHVVVVEYRRTGMPGGGWPGTFTDVLTAVGAVCVDPSVPERCVLVGHSAGGHLVALAAARPEAARLAGVVILAGNVDLALVRDLHLGDDAARRFLGDAPDDAESWADADPARHPPRVPVVLVHGDEDDTVPLAVSESYVAATQGRGGPVKLRRIPGAGHFELIDPSHEAFSSTLESVAELAPS